MKLGLQIGDGNGGGKSAMSERKQILYMQTRILRLASEKWNKPMEMVSGLFTRYGVLRYIEECFDMFHIEGDEAILEDVEAYLRNRGMAESAEVDK